MRFDGMASIFHGGRIRAERTLGEPKLSDDTFLVVLYDGPEYITATLLCL